MCAIAGSLMQTTPYSTASEVAQQTTSPIIPGTEWIRPADARACFGIGRSTLYSLIKDGAVKSVVLRRKGAAKGCRLVSTASIRALLAGMEVAE